KQALAAVGQRATIHALPAQTQRDDQGGRQRQGRRVAGIDYGFNFLCPPSGSLYLQANTALVGLDHAGDHGVPCRCRPPKRWTEREPIRTIQICASGTRARSLSHASSSSAATS